MDSENECNVNPESHMDDALNAGLSEIARKNQSSHVTSLKEEAAESDVDSLLCQSGQAGNLKSVQEYTGRIKSFLGWDSNEGGEAVSKDEISDLSIAKDVSEEDGEVCERDAFPNAYHPWGKSSDVICAQERDTSSRPIDNVNELGESSELGESIGLGDSNGLGESNGLDESSELGESNELGESKGLGESRFTELNRNCEDTEILHLQQNDPSLILSSADNLNTLEPELADDKSDNSILEGVPRRADAKMESFALDDHSSSVSSEKNCNAATVDTIHNDSMNTRQEEESEALNEKAEIKMRSQDNLQIIQNLDVNSEEIPNTDFNQADTKNDVDAEASHNEDDLNRPVDNVLLNKNVTKPYMDNIRRLSLDIVKDVINSARSSIHELHNTKEQAKDKSNGDPAETNNADSASNGSSEHQFHKASDNSRMKDSSMLKEDFSDIIDEDTICGFGCFKSQWLQKWATPKVYLFVFSLIGVVHGSYYNYFVAMISTLEKRYAFRSKVSGTLLLADEITPLVLGIIVGYIGGKTHRPRMVALGMFLSATCCFVTALPYLIYGSAKHLKDLTVKNVTSMEFCDTAFNNTSCNEDDQPPTMSVVGLFLFASFLKGFATLSYYVIGIPYMDDNAKKKYSPLYLAIALALRLLGPLVGFLMSSGFLKFYENPFEDPGFGPDDPRWIGAWWMGFCVQGVLLVIFTIPIALFPRRLPGHKKPEQFISSGDKDRWKNMFSGLLDALKRLWKNPIFVFLAINTTMKIFGHFGHAIMLPKYMENQFRLSASDASLFSGATSIFCIMMSTILGGFLIWKYRPTAKTLLAGMIASEVTLCLGYLVLMIPHCQPAAMQHFGTNDNGLILNSMCNQNCDCSTNSFSPFCGPDGKTTYFSPCFAGCTLQLDSVMIDKERKEFGNCSCVADDGEMGAKITEGFCVDETCWTQTLAYICILLLLVTISNTLTVAHTMILLRSVHPNDKSVALGTFETFICLFGFIPFPITYGALVDSACLIWEKSCGQTGNCWFYDMKKYNYLLHGASFFFCFVSVLCLTTLYCFSSRVKCMYKDDDEDEQDPMTIKLDTVSGSVTKL